MLVRLSHKNQPDPAKIRFRCRCGHEYPMLNNPGCPVCGRSVPREVSIDNGPWQSHLEFKIHTMRQILEPGALDETPQQYHDAIRQHAQQQIRELEDGSWKVKTQQKIGTLQQTLAAPVPPAVPAHERDNYLAQIKSSIQRLQEELDAAQ